MLFFAFKVNMILHSQFCFPNRMHFQLKLNIYIINVSMQILVQKMHILSQKSLMHPINLTPLAFIAVAFIILINRINYWQDFERLPY